MWEEFVGRIVFERIAGAAEQDAEGVQPDLTIGGLVVAD